MAFRVVVDDVGDCYQALGVIHCRLPGACPGASRTTSRRPKPNSYRSLHTGVIGPERQRIEVQIRTARHARGRRARRRRALDLQAGRAGDRRAGNTAGCASCSTSSSTPPNAGGIPRAHQARDVPGPGLLLHAEGRSDRAAARRHAGRFRLCRAFSQSATPASAPRSTAGCCRCARSCRTATRSRSSPRKAQTPSPTWERFVVTGKARAAHPPLRAPAPARRACRARPRPADQGGAPGAGGDVRQAARAGLELAPAQVGRRPAERGRATAAAAPRAVLEAVHPDLKRTDARGDLDTR